MKAIKDLFDREILKYTFAPLILSLLFWGIVFYFFWDSLVELILNYANYLPYSDKIKTFITSTEWLFESVIYYILTISTLGLFSSFFVDKIVLKINQKHYNCPVKESTFKDTLKGVLISLYSLLIYLIVFMFTFWMLFIPIFNIIYQMFMFTLLNKKPLLFDSSYLFGVKVDGLKIFFIIFLTSVVYFIPILSWFGYTIQLIFVTHEVLKKCKGEV